MIVARKPHKCAACFATIAKGEKYYRYNGIYNGEYQYWGMHEECYAAFDASEDDSFSPGDFPVPERVRAQMPSWNSINRKAGVVPLNSYQELHQLCEASHGPFGCACKFESHITLIEVWDAKVDEPPKVITRLTLGWFNQNGTRFPILEHTKYVETIQ